MLFAYVIAPAIDAVSRRVRFGRRRRPLSRPVSIVVVYVALFACGALAWHRAAPIVGRWVHVTAPAVIDRVFTGDRRPAAVDRLYADVPLPGRAKQVTAQATMTLLAYVEGEVRAALGELVDAARYVHWLAVPPVIAFLLLAYAPGFRRSALRALPHGHLQWRGDEYLRDVNSALAGYVRAQLAAGVIVATACTAVFSLFHLPYAVSMGIGAGVLELVPVIGPLTVILMAAGQAEQHAVALVIALAARRVGQDLVIYPPLIRHGMHLSSAA